MSPTRYWCTAAGIDLRRQAILFRSQHHSGRLEIELAGRNIPFVKYGGLKFIEAAHVKDLLASCVGQKTFVMPSLVFAFSNCGPGLAQPTRRR